MQIHANILHLCHPEWIWVFGLIFEQQTVIDTLSYRRDFMALGDPYITMPSVWLLSYKGTGDTPITHASMDFFTPKLWTNQQICTNGPRGVFQNCLVLTVLCGKYITTNKKPRQTDIQLKIMVTNISLLTVMSIMIWVLSLLCLYQYWHWLKAKTYTWAFGADSYHMCVYRHALNRNRTLIGWSLRWYNSKLKFRGFETLQRDLTTRHLIGYWNTVPYAICEISLASLHPRDA